MINRLKQVAIFHLCMCSVLNSHYLQSNSDTCLDTYADNLNNIVNYTNQSHHHPVFAGLSTLFATGCYAMLGKRSIKGPLFIASALYNYNPWYHNTVTQMIDNTLQDIPSEYYPKLAIFTKDYKNEHCKNVACNVALANIIDQLKGLS